MACKDVLYTPFFYMGDVVVSDKKKLIGIQVLRAVAFLEIFLGHCGEFSQCACG